MLPVIFVLIAVVLVSTTLAARHLNRRRARTGGQLRERLADFAANREYEQAAEQLAERFLRGELSWADALADLERRFDGSAADHEAALTRWRDFHR